MASAGWVASLLVALSDDAVDEVCDWPRVDGASLSPAEFQRLYFEKKPVVLMNLMKDWPAVIEQSWSEERIIEKYGNLSVHTSHIATNCRGLWEFRSGLTIAEFLRSGAPASWFMQPWHPMAQDMLARKDFLRPRLLQSVSNEGPAISIGRRSQGNIFHFHDHNWLAQVHGKKRWLVLPPSSRIPPHDMSSRSADGPCAPRPRWKDLSGCAVEAGEIAYVPSTWWHETCYYSNYSIGVAYVGSSGAKGVGENEQDIWQAVIAGDLSFLEAITDASSRARKQSELGELPLNLAARHGHVETVRWLLGSRASLNAAQKRDGLTAVYTAATNGHLPVVESLLEHRASLQGVDQQKRTLLHNIALRGHVEVMRYLLDDRPAGHGGASNSKQLRIADKNGMNALQIAAGSGHVDCVEFLIARRSSALETSKAGGQALHFASFNGHANVAELLLKHRADPHVHNAQGMQAAASAAEAKLGNDRTLRVLLAARADLASDDNANGQTALHVAAQAGQVSSVRSLLALRGDVHASAQGGIRPALLAAFGGHAIVLEHLQRSRADLNSRSEDGWRPIHGAAQGGHAAAVEKLLELRANSAAKGPGGSKALVVAKEAGHKDVVQLLSKRSSGKKGGRGEL